MCKGDSVSAANELFKGVSKGGCYEREKDTEGCVSGTET